MNFIHKNFLLTFVLVVFSLTGLQGLAIGQGTAIDGLDKTMIAAGDARIQDALGDGGAGRPSVSRVIGQIIGGVLGLMGSIFFILLVYGGFMWMTARGNESQVEKARTIITWAVWGVVIILLAYLVVDLVFEVGSEIVS